MREFKVHKASGRIEVKANAPGLDANAKRLDFVICRFRRSLQRDETGWKR